jgi:hypothetical protein
VRRCVAFEGVVIAGSFVFLGVSEDIDLGVMVGCVTILSLNALGLKLIAELF